MNPLKRLGIRFPFPTEGYRINQAGREIFIYEEPQRKARIAGQMLTRGDRLFFGRLEEYMKARRLPYEVEE